MWFTRPITKRYAPLAPAATVTATPTFLPIGLSVDRKTVFGVEVATNKIATSTNSGTSWTALGTAFAGTSPTKLTYARETGDGEILVISDTTTTYGSLWKSSGWATSPATATFTEVLRTGNNPGQHLYFHASYNSLSIDPFGSGFCVASEFGVQVESSGGHPDQAAIHSWYSKDFGATWTPFLNLLDLIPTASHFHTVAYDPWWDVVWMAFGDGKQTATPGGIQIAFTADLGRTWTWIQRPKNGPTFGGYQTVGIYPGPAGVVLGQDDTPNAIWRIGRRGYRKPGQIQQTIMTRNDSNPVISYSWYHERGDILISVAQANARPAGQGLTSLYYSPDGLKFWKVYSDPALNAAGDGFVQTVGPTTDGKIIGKISSSGSRIVLDLNELEESPPTVSGSATIADGATIAHGLGFTPPRRSVTPTVAGRTVAVTAADATNLTVALRDSAGAAVTVAEPVLWSAGI
jgi:hypothetical protein